MKKRVIFSLLGATAIATVLALPIGQAQAVQSPASRSDHIATMKLDSKGIVPLSSGGKSITPADLVGFGWTYRHNWGLKNGFWRLNLTSASFTANTRAFVSIHECNHLGDAKYLVYNVVPNNGVVSIRVHVDWGAPIPLCADYMFVNP
jgi:hypothetical protein